MKSIYILSGPVHSGKTTKLSKWFAGKNAAGILAPVVNNQRYLLDILTNERKLLDSKRPVNSKEVTSIGKYAFENSVFKWGCKIILESAQGKYDWLVIDEFGLLELKGKGLANAVDHILSDKFELKDTNVLIVIRNGLVQDFLNRHNLLESEITQFDFPCN
jgi:nucleoside-triphosphatase THEP1